MAAENASSATALTSAKGAPKHKVLMVHNAYQQRGGEDSVVDSEIALLRQHGHEVEVYRRHNDDVGGQSKASLALQTLWSRQTTAEIDRLIDAFQPDVIHVHNTLPLVSPSIYWAAKRRGCAVVQTLHNFRLMCPQAMFLRDGKVCEDCLGHVPWRGVLRGCYRQSVPQTAVLATSVVLHRALGTYDRAVTCYIALNNFCRDKFIEGGLAAEQVLIKPNFVEDQGRADEAEPRAGGLFVGRLSHDKGVQVLLSALRTAPNLRCEVVGTGELEDQARAQLGEAALGFRPVPEILARMRGAAFLVVPSLWYENFPRTLVEAYSCGLPVIASRLGALAELVEEGRTGLLFNPGDPTDLAAKMAWAQAHPQAMRDMGRQARAIYEQHYSPEPNYRRLIEIYDQAMRKVKAGGQ